MMPNVALVLPSSRIEYAGVYGGRRTGLSVPYDRRNHFWPS